MSHCAYFSLTSGYTFKGDSLVVRACCYGKIANLTLYQPSWWNVAVVTTTCSWRNLRVLGLTTWIGWAVIQGGCLSSGGSREERPPSHLFLDQTEAQRAKKKFLRPPPPFYLLVWMTGPPVIWRSGSATVIWGCALNRIYTVGGLISYCGELLE